jgi:hypothetical protein
MPACFTAAPVQGPVAYARHRHKPWSKGCRRPACGSGADLQWDSTFVWELEFSGRNCLHLVRRLIGGWPGRGGQSHFNGSGAAGGGAMAGKACPGFARSLSFFAAVGRILVIAGWPLFLPGGPCLPRLLTNLSIPPSQRFRSRQDGGCTTPHLRERCHAPNPVRKAAGSERARAFASRVLGTAG